MSKRYAMRVTDELLAMSRALTGSDEDAFENVDQLNLFLVIEALSPTKFILEVKVEDDVLEEFKNDPNIEIVY